MKQNSYLNYGKNLKYYSSKSHSELEQAIFLPFLTKMLLHFGQNLLIGSYQLAKSHLG